MLHRYGGESAKPQISKFEYWSQSVGVTQFMIDYISFNLEIVLADLKQVIASTMHALIA